MDARKILLFAVVVCLALCTAESKRKKKDKKPKPSRYPSKDNDDKIQELETSIDKLQKQVNTHCSDEAGNNSGNHVYFHFHGDEHDDNHDADGHTHVDVFVHTQHDDHHKHHGRHEGSVAHCELTNSEITGHVHIVQEENEDFANFYVDFDHLGNANDNFPMHVHEFGDCKSVGPHYNPQEEYTHIYSPKESTDIPSDLGDLGTVETDDDGAVVGTWKNDTHLSLAGKLSILGRSIVVHDPAGGKIGCCVIGLTSSGHDGEHSGGHTHG